MKLIFIIGYNVAAKLKCPLWRKVKMSLWAATLTTRTSPDLTGWSGLQG